MTTKRLALLFLRNIFPDVSSGYCELDGGAGSLKIIFELPKGGSYSSVTYYIRAIGDRLEYDRVVAKNET